MQKVLAEQNTQRAASSSGSDPGRPCAQLLVPSFKHKYAHASESEALGRVKSQRARDAAAADDGDQTLRLLSARAPPPLPPPSPPCLSLTTQTSGHSLNQVQSVLFFFYCFGVTIAPLRHVARPVRPQATI